jgi:glycosyltransferase involved in cell wall biosynthesis
MPGMLVSCIVPVFNGAAYLREALESALAQTYRPFELLVVDDGSTDGSAAVARAFGERIRLIEQPNRGPAAARNAGVVAARGKLVAFLDADDLWSPDKIAAQVRRLAEVPDLDLCFTRFQNFWVDELRDEAVRYQHHPIAQPSDAWSICTLLARRASLDRFGPFDESLRAGENMTWFVRAVAEGARLEVLPDILMRRRLHGANVTRAAGSLNFDQFFPILKAWRDRTRRQPPAARLS